MPSLFWPTISLKETVPCPTSTVKDLVPDTVEEKEISLFTVCKLKGWEKVNAPNVCVPNVLMLVVLTEVAPKLDKFVTLLILDPKEAVPDPELIVRLYVLPFTVAPWPKVILLLFDNKVISPAKAIAPWYDWVPFVVIDPPKVKEVKLFDKSNLGKVKLLYVALPSTFIALLVPITKL